MVSVRTELEGRGQRLAAGVSYRMETRERRREEEEERRGRRRGKGRES